MKNIHKWKTRPNKNGYRFIEAYCTKCNCKFPCTSPSSFEEGKKNFEKVKCES